MAIKLPLSILDYSRSVASDPDIKLHNRYYEQDPTNTDNQVALISRPAMRKWLTMATAPSGRAVYSEPGTFGEALFNCAGNTVYKIAQDETVTAIGTLTTSTGYVSMAATETHLFIADGASLSYYTENEYARGTLTTTGTVSAAETVVIGTVHYKFAADVTTAADGTATNPWLVLLGNTTNDSLTNLAKAIINSGTAGTDYSAALAGNPDVTVSSQDETTLKVRAFKPGTSGNSLATTETMANASWGGATLSGGGGSAFATISVPDNKAIVSVCVIDNFTICVVGLNQQENGRYYFVRPGEITIDALDFETAERSPDPAFNAVGLGDHFLLPGSSGTEDHYPTGDGNAPFQRQQGHLYDIPVWEGTVVKMDQDVMMVASDGRIIRWTDGPQVVSTPGVTQRIREHINAQRAS